MDWHEIKQKIENSLSNEIKEFGDKMILQFGPEVEMTTKLLYLEPKDYDSYGIFKLICKAYIEIEEKEYLIYKKAFSVLLSDILGV